MSVGNGGDESQGQKWSGISTERSRRKARRGEIDIESRERTRPPRYHQYMTTQMSDQIIKMNGGGAGKTALPRLPRHMRRLRTSSRTW